MHLVCTRLACSEEIAVGTAVSAAQQDPSFQFPAPVSIPALFRAGTCEVGIAKGRMQHLADTAPRSTERGKLILSEGNICDNDLNKNIG